MKKNSYLYILASLALTVTSCSTKFLEEKRDLTGANEEVFSDPILAQNYVDYIYWSFMPANNAQSLTWNIATGNDDFTKTTDELAGETNWNKPWNAILYTQAHALAYFGSRMNTSIANNTWTRIKQINLFLEGVEQNPGLSADLKRRLRGQMYFWRAYQNFDLVRLYGGIPIIKTTFNPIIEDGNSDAQVQRSKTSECIKFICDDLDSAINNLPGKWTGADWGRITSGGAAALKGRVLLTWASPLFNRGDNIDRWKDAYEANIAAKKLLEDNGFGLYKVGGIANGTAWGNMFTVEGESNIESVIMFGFNNVASGNSQRNNGWEQATRSREIAGGGSVSPTKELVDAFPMRDGKMPGSSATYPYSLQNFYRNRDPRFYKTFVYTGALWPYGANTSYRQWSYVWKKTASVASYDATTETKGANNSGIYLCKANNPAANTTSGNFSQSGTDFMEMRFAEVLLNLAESAIGYNRPTEGLDNIKLVRERAGISAADNYGLGTIGGRDQLFAAVLKERQIELAYEGKRFFDLRRWMLFDATAGTAARLGFTPLNGTRRTGFFVSVKRDATNDYVGNADPMIKPTPGNAPVIDRNPLTYPPGVTTYDQYVDYLYDNYFKVSVRDNLETTSTAGWTFKWYPEYYFFGINSNVMDASTYLQQTIGWNNLNGAGTFDPLQ